MKEAIAVATYTSREVAALAGVTFRQLDYWARRGVMGEIDAPGSGRHRRFTADDIRLFKVLGRVSALAVSLAGSVSVGSTELYAEIVDALRTNPQAAWLVVTPHDVSAENVLDPVTLPAEALVCRIDP